MKKIMLFAAVLVSMNAFAQKIDGSKVPQTVKKTFAANFPIASNVTWENEKGKYEASFTVKNNKMSALFDQEGKWLETERIIDMKNLPADAKEYIQKRYNGKIDEVSEIKKLNGEVNYEAHVKKGSDLMFNAQGKYVNTVKE